ncbi:MAG: T9SS type A sorting domain-containing protein [Saprospiraceae bacterium]|nr:T9SS type A sorting domain-containing protein [Saprospiraceae bacterium]
MNPLLRLFWNITFPFSLLNVYHYPIVDNENQTTNAIQKTVSIASENPEIICEFSEFRINYNCFTYVELYCTVKSAGSCDASELLYVATDIDLNGDGKTDRRASSDFPVEWQGYWFYDSADETHKTYIKPRKYLSGDFIKLPKFESYQSNQINLVNWTVNNQCGNSATCVQEFSTPDKKPPRPVTKPIITASFDYNSYDTIDRSFRLEYLAKNFNVHSSDECTSEENLLFTFWNIPPQTISKTVYGKVINVSVSHYFDNSGGLAAFPIDSNDTEQLNIVKAYNKGTELSTGNGFIQLWKPEVKSSARIYNSVVYKINKHLLTDTFEMMTVWDENMNEDFAWTHLKLVHHTRPIEPKIFIGKVVNLLGNGIHGAHISQEPEVNNIPVFSDSTGEFRMNGIHNIEHKFQVSYSPEKAAKININDYLVLKNHLDNVEMITDPYLLIAADINQDRELDENDLHQLLTAITDPENNDNNIWKAIPIQDDLNTSNWSGYKENIETYSIKPLNFIAFQLGDLDLSGFKDEQECATKEIRIYEKVVRKNDIFIAEFKTSPISEITFFQCLLELKDVELIDIISENPHLEYTNIIQDSSSRLILWLNPSTYPISEPIKWSIRFKALKDGTVSNLLRLDQQITGSVYKSGSNCTGNYEYKVLPPLPNEIQLFKNHPNPFVEKTTITYSMPAEADVHIYFTDIVGRNVFQYSASSSKGINELVIDRAQLKHPGTYIYTLKSGDTILSEKMILLR